MLYNYDYCYQEQANFQVSDYGIDYDKKGFGDYLKNPGELFTIDLSNATLLEAIGKMTEIKSRMSPGYGKRLED